MLLPEAASSPEPCRVMVATLPIENSSVSGTRKRRVVAAVVISEHHIVIPMRGPKTLAHVIPPLRRRGIGRALIDAIGGHVVAVSGAQGRDPQVLYAWSLVEPESTEAEVWKSVGFTERSDALIHEVDTRTTEKWLRPAYERIAATIPADARVVFLHDATASQKQQIAAMHVKHLGGRPEEMQALIGGPAPYFRSRSLVLLHGERVVGFSLGRDLPEKGVVLVEANVLEPEYRMGWANLLIKYEGARRLLDTGIDRARFQTFEHHADTRGFARRSGDTVTRRLTQFYRPLPPRA